MIVAILSGILLLLLCFAVWFCLHLSVLREKPIDLDNPQLLGMTHMRDVIPMVQESKRWLEQQEKEDWYIYSHDGKKLHGIFVPRENARGTLVFFHGYRSSYAIDFAGAMAFYYEQGLNLLICEQRAHGESQGHFLTFGAKERYDVQSWTNYLSAIFGEDHPVILTGLSMGATTVLMASNLDHAVDIRGIIADCGFTSPEAICRHVSRHRMHLPENLTIPILGLITRLICGFRLNECSTVQSVQQTKYPIFFIHGRADDFVPCSMTEENFAACRSEKEVLYVEGAGHGLSFVVAPEEYRKRLSAFLDKHI